jgi:16S rRNA (guanine966-N2)-methyltransferase
MAPELAHPVRVDGHRVAVRIISGSLKGRRLKTPTWGGLRPTSDKLRETLFNIVAPRVSQARVLDAYAGTGAIGIEALSRGAAHVAFVDMDPKALALIRENLTLCGVADRYVIIRARLGSGGSALAWSPAPEYFDLAVLDPPYDEPDLGAAIRAAEPLVAAGGLLVLEHARRRPAPEAEAGLSCVREVASGDSALAFYQRVPQP